MLFSVKFHVGMREVRMLMSSAGREISQEEGDGRLSPSSTVLLELVLFNYLFCVFFGLVCESKICFNNA